MSDFFTRLAERALGVAKRVRPAIGSRYEIGRSLDEPIGNLPAREDAIETGGEARAHPLEERRKNIEPIGHEHTSSPDSSAEDASPTLAPPTRESVRATESLEETAPRAEDDHTRQAVPVNPANAPGSRAPRVSRRTDERRPPDATPGREATDRNTPSGSEPLVETHRMQDARVTSNGVAAAEPGRSIRIAPRTDEMKERREPEPAADSPRQGARSGEARDRPSMRESESPPPQLVTVFVDSADPVEDPGRVPSPTLRPVAVGGTASALRGGLSSDGPRFASRETAPAPVHVHIGSVEIRAERPQQKTPQQPPARRQPALTLDEYLRQRNEGRS